jgi:rod shape determining protein RodA
MTQAAARSVDTGARRSISTPDRRWDRLLRAVRALDLMLLAAALALSVIGAVLIYSATRGRLLAAGDDPRAFLDKHLINIAIGMVIAWAVATLGYRTLRAATPWVYGLAIALLLAVLSPLGTVQNGIQAWLVLPAGFSLQPSELAKVAVVLVVGLALTHRAGQSGLAAESTPSGRDVAAAMALAGLPLALILLQPDLGTVLVVAATVLGMLAIAGTPARWLWAMLAAAAAVAAVVLLAGVLDDYQIDRLTTFLDPAADPLGSGYNTRMARLAIAGGGLVGQGLFHGAQTQGRLVPYQQTDFVFSVAGEELGLLGAGLIIVLVGIVLWRGTRIAMAAPDRFGRVVAAGIVVWFAVQAFENIGMNLGIMPVTGVPLPFVSYGGSSMFAVWAGVGLLTSVQLRSHRRR